MDVSFRRRAFRLDTDENAYFGTARRHSCRRDNKYRQRESSSSRVEVPGLHAASQSGQISRLRVPTCGFDAYQSRCLSERYQGSKGGLRTAQAGVDQPREQIVRSGIEQSARRIYASSSTQDSRTSSLVLRLSLREVWFASARQSGCSKPSKPDQGLLASFATRDRIA